MKTLKILASVLAISLFASLAMSFPASAAETKDTYFPEITIGYARGTGHNTITRPKTNTSSNYVHNKSGFNLNIVTRNSAGGNYTVGGNAIVPTAQRRIRTTIYESGYRSCYLDINTVYSGTSGILKGVWSPDCTDYAMKNYPAAN